MSHSATPLISPSQMAAVDRNAMDSGIDGYGLMEAAGAVISACVLRHYPDAQSALVLCGPGNNGGDGFVAARRLRECGFPVAVSCLIDPQDLSGDAARAFRQWGGPVDKISPDNLPENGLIVDALFGGGLDRPIQGSARSVIEAINMNSLPVVSADLPSGISGLTGQVFGVALAAEHTVSFAAPRPGHFLLPGSTHCGILQIADIGIPDRIVHHLEHHLWVNSPAIWQNHVPMMSHGDHKYTRGHLGVFSGSFSQTGAARLAAIAGLRAGAGLVTVLSPGAALAANAAHLTALMLRRMDDEEDLDLVLSDDRMSGYVLGPAFGVGDKARAFVERIAGSGKPLVLDADGLTAFAGQAHLLKSLYSRSNSRLLLTPHHGEFARLFPQIVSDGSLSKVDRALAAAEHSNAVVLYKGADTVIASPDGRAVVNANAPPWLATAGSGDCLAGIAGGLLAQQMPVFEAAAAAAYLHGMAGQSAGQGLTADDIASHIPSLSSLQQGDLDEQ